jgi:hypothetical protein
MWKFHSWTLNSRNYLEDLHIYGTTILKIYLKLFSYESVDWLNMTKILVAGSYAHRTDPSSPKEDAEFLGY